MAAVRPPVPRRPIPLPTTGARDNSESDSEAPRTAPKDLAARIAALSIAVSSADAKAKGFTLAKASVPPRIPARSQSSLANGDLDVGRLLARKPPPPPAMKRASTIPISHGYGAPPPTPKRASRIVSNPQSKVEATGRPPLPPPRRASSFNPPSPREEYEQESYTEPASPPPPRRRVPPPPTELPEQEEYEEPPPVPFRRRLPPPPSEEPEEEEYIEPPPPVPYRRRLPPPRAEEPKEEEHEEPSPPPPPRRRLPPPIDRSKPPPPTINETSKPQRTAPLAARQHPDHGSCLKCRDFTEADTHASYFPRQEVTTLSDLAYNLTSPFEADVDKARVIFTWLHLNIAYNVADFFSGNIKHATPESTLRSGLAVCGGYAGLFKHLAEMSGLQAHEVSGHGKGFGYAPLGPGERPPPESSGHAWNCVYFEGEWHLIDPCWGAGAISDTYTQRFDPTWFHSSVEEFGLRHFPTDRSYQLTEVPKTWEEYITSPPNLLVPSTVLENGYDPYSILPSTSPIPGGQYVQFKIAKLCVHMSVAPQDNYSLLLYSGEDRVPLEFNYDEYAWTATCLTPTNGQVILMFVDTLNGQDARGTNATQYMGRAAMSFKSLASWPVEV